jgi:hypothetical protein
LLLDLPRTLLLIPASMARIHVDQTVLAIPLTEYVVRLASDRPESTLHEGEHAGDLVAAAAGGEELLDAEVGIADAHERDVIGVVTLEVVIPDIADHLFQLLVELVFGEFGLLVGSGVVVVDVGWHVNVNDAETLFDGPFYIEADGVGDEGIVSDGAVGDGIDVGGDLGTKDFRRGE